MDVPNIYMAWATGDAGKKVLQSVRQSVSFLSSVNLLQYRAEKAALIRRVHARDSKIMADVTGNMRHRACSEKDLASLAISVKEFKKIFAETFDKHCDCSLYTLRHYLSDHMLEIIQRFGALYSLLRSVYEHFNTYVKRTFRRPLRRRRARLMETENVMEKSMRDHCLRERGDSWEVETEI